MSDFDARLEVRPGVSTLPVGLAWTIGLLSTLAGAGRRRRPHPACRPAPVSLRLRPRAPRGDRSLGLPDALRPDRRPLPGAAAADLSRRAGDDPRAGPTGPGAGRHPAGSPAPPGPPCRAPAPPGGRRPLARGLGPGLSQRGMAGGAAASSARAASAEPSPWPSPSRASRAREGSGKTTTCAALAGAFGEMGQRVLAIDVDPQSNLTSGLGFNPYQLERTIVDILVDPGLTPDAVTLATEWERISLIPASPDLSAVEGEMATTVGRELRLRDALRRGSRAARLRHRAASTPRPTSGSTPSALSARPPGSWCPCRCRGTR